MGDTLGTSSQLLHPSSLVVSPSPSYSSPLTPAPSTCLKSQVVDLKAEGYWEELMDTTRPDIEVKDW